MSKKYTFFKVAIVSFLLTVGLGFYLQAASKPSLSITQLEEKIRSLRAELRRFRTKTELRDGKTKKDIEDEILAVSKDMAALSAGGTGGSGSGSGVAVDSEVKRELEADIKSAQENIKQFEKTIKAAAAGGKLLELNLQEAAGYKTSKDLLRRKKAFDSESAASVVAIDKIVLDNFDKMIPSRFELIRDQPIPDDKKKAIEERQRISKIKADVASIIYDIQPDNFSVVVSKIKKLISDGVPVDDEELVRMRVSMRGFVEKARERVTRLIAKDPAKVNIDDVTDGAADASILRTYLSLGSNKDDQALVETFFNRFKQYKVVSMSANLAPVSPSTQGGGAGSGVGGSSGSPTSAPSITPTVTPTSPRSGSDAKTAQPAPAPVYLPWSKYIQAIDAINKKFESSAKKKDNPKLYNENDARYSLKELADELKTEKALEEDEKAAFMRTEKALLNAIFQQTGTSDDIVDTYKNEQSLESYRKLYVDHVQNDRFFDDVYRLCATKTSGAPSVLSFEDWCVFVEHINLVIAIIKPTQVGSSQSAKSLLRNAFSAALVQAQARGITARTDDKTYASQKSFFKSISLLILNPSIAYAMQYWGTDMIALSMYALLREPWMGQEATLKQSLKRVTGDNKLGERDQENYNSIIQSAWKVLYKRLDAISIRSLLDKMMGKSPNVDNFLKIVQESAASTENPVFVQIVELVKQYTATPPTIKLEALTKKLDELGGSGLGEAFKTKYVKEAATSTVDTKKQKGEIKDPQAVHKKIATQIIAGRGGGAELITFIATLPSGDQKLLDDFLKKFKSFSVEFKNILLAFAKVLPPAEALPPTKPGEGLLYFIWDPTYLIRTYKISEMSDVVAGDFIKVLKNLPTSKSSAIALSSIVQPLDKSTKDVSLGGVNSKFFEPWLYKKYEGLFAKIVELLNSNSIKEAFAFFVETFKRSDPEIFLYKNDLDFLLESVDPGRVDALMEDRKEPSPASIPLGGGIPDAPDAPPMAPDAPPMAPDAPPMAPDAPGDPSMSAPWVGVQITPAYKAFIAKHKAYFLALNKLYATPANRRIVTERAAKVQELYNNLYQHTIFALFMKSKKILKELLATDYDITGLPSFNDLGDDGDAVLRAFYNCIEQVIAPIATTINSVKLENDEEEPKFLIVDSSKESKPAWLKQKRAMFDQLQRGFQAVTFTGKALPDFIKTVGSTGATEADIKTRLELTVTIFLQNMLDPLDEYFGKRERLNFTDFVNDNSPAQKLLFDDYHMISAKTGSGGSKVPIKTPTPASGPSGSPSSTGKSLLDELRPLLQDLAQFDKKYNPEQQQKLATDLYSLRIAGTDVNNLTLLHFGAKQKAAWAVLAKLIRLNAKALDAVDSTGKTPLHYVVESNTPAGLLQSVHQDPSDTKSPESSLVEFFITPHNIDMVSSDGDTVLTYAVGKAAGISKQAKEWDPVIRALKSRRANPTIKNTRTKKSSIDMARDLTNPVRRSELEKLL